MQIENFLFCACILVVYLQHGVTKKNEKCFCQLAGMIDDCFCDVETLETFNNKQIYPKIQELIQHDFFKYYKVNLFKGCKFWNGDIGLCEDPACGVKLCDEEDIPEGLREKNFAKYIEQYEVCLKPNELGNINSTLSNVTLDSLTSWDRHDTNVLDFCELDDENSAGMEYVDLTINPERFTGYSGQKAWRIWKAIYEENCFMPESIRKRDNPIFPLFNREKDFKPSFNSFSSRDLEGLCLEKRVFYRVISGLHTSINIHLCADYLFKDGDKEPYWGSNLNEFQRRFDPDHPNGEQEGPNRLRNLYFIYLLELRALSKVAKYFEREDFILFTGEAKEDIKTKILLLELLELTQQFPMHFDEEIMFQNAESKALKNQFRETFVNVTRIIDCVTCQKCRLWGKLQTQGLGTALKILFSSKEITHEKFHLERQEIVSLINAFGRLSNSIKKLENFKQLLGSTTKKQIKTKNDEL